MGTDVPAGTRDKSLGGTVGVGAVSTALTTDDVSGWNRAALATVRALAGTPYRTVVTVSAGRSIAASSRWCAGTVAVPPGGTPGYGEALRRRVAEGDYGAVLPASDVALDALFPASARLVDKTMLAAVLAEVGLPVVPGRRFSGVSELRSAAEELDYPVVAKSVVKCGVDTLQATRLDGVPDLHSLPDAPGELLVQPVVDGPMSALSGVVWQGTYLALCHQRYERTWPPRAGVASAAVTVGPDATLEERLLPVLAGHDGVFQVQLIGPYVIDVNPRVYGSMSLAVAAGANLPLVACEAAAGRPGKLQRARPGVAYRWLEGDLRHLVTELRNGRYSGRDAVRRLLPSRGTAYSVESWRDPGPALTRLSGALRARVRSRT